MNEALNCAINITRVIPSALLDTFQVRQKGLSPLRCLSKSREITGWPKAAIDLTQSDKVLLGEGGFGNTYHSQVSTVPGYIPQYYGYK